MASTIVTFEYYIKNSIKMVKPYYSSFNAEIISFDKFYLFISYLIRFIIFFFFYYFLFLTFLLMVFIHS